MKEWHPIETAPKDGTLVLLHPSGHWTADVNSDCEVGYWDVDCEEWIAAGSRADDYTGPTHWMPLPEPPSPAASEPPAPGSDSLVSE
jgi:hypothetical protein